MDLLNRLERPLGWIAIGGLPVYVVAAQAILFVWTMLNPGSAHLLMMDPYLVVQGHEWWRVLTFLFLVPFDNAIWAFFFLYFQFVCGQALENEWGSFRLTLFYLLGALGCIAAAFIVGQDLSAAFFLNDTVFLAFAALYPDYQVYLFLILPLRVKWLAWFVWARILLTMIGSPWLFRLGIVVSLANYFIFFSGHHVQTVRELIARARHRRRYRGFDE
jgi:hypothetical protein